MGGQEIAHERRRHERDVARQDDDRAVLRKRGERRLERVGGPVRALLDGQDDVLGQVAVERARGGVDDDDRPAPASRAAWIGQCTSGRPQRGCRTFGRAERIRLPLPAARITTVGAVMAPRLGAPPGGRGRKTPDRAVVAERAPLASAPDLQETIWRRSR